MRANRADRGTAHSIWHMAETGVQGEGGQGEVFRARQMSAPQHFNSIGLADTIRQCAGHHGEERAKAADWIVSLVRDIAREAAAQDCAPIGALKVLHGQEEGKASEKASTRMAAELGALTKLEHPSLVRVLDADLSERWFVMEYFSSGSLLGQLENTRGDVLGSLLRFRPLVHAVAELHKSGFVHRDIKPGNVFVASDGHLVLGDFGLVIDTGADDLRVTDTYENVGSRDWMPGWAYGKRMDEVRPDFDVFSLGKLLWSMVSGKPFLRLWYFQEDEFSLEKMFPETPAMRWVTRLLAKCVVQRETDCAIKDASELLNEVDQTIEALRLGGQVLRRTDGFALRCRVCGLGVFHVRVQYASEPMVLHCEACGYEYRFKDTSGWE